MGSCCYGKQQQLYSPAYRGPKTAFKPPCLWITLYPKAARSSLVGYCFCNFYNCSFREFENSKNLTKSLASFELCSKHVSHSLMDGRMPKRQCNPQIARGCIFSCFLSHIHFRLPQALRTTMASNSQKKNPSACHKPQLLNSPRACLKPETHWKQLMGVTAWLQAGYAQGEASSWLNVWSADTSGRALSPGMGYGIRVRMHKSLDSPKRGSLNCASMTGGLNYQQCSTCSWVHSNFKKPPLLVHHAAAPQLNNIRELCMCHGNITISSCWSCQNWFLKFTGIENDGMAAPTSSPITKSHIPHDWESVSVQQGGRKGEGSWWLIRVYGDCICEPKK